MKGIAKFLLRGCAGTVGMALKVLVQSAYHLRFLVFWIGRFFRFMGRFCIACAVLSFMGVSFVQEFMGVNGFEWLFIICGLLFVAFGMFLIWIQGAGAETVYIFSEKCMDYCLQRKSDYYIYYDD